MLCCMVCMHEPCPLLSKILTVSIPTLFVVVIDLKAQRAQNEELEDELTRARKEAAVTPVCVVHLCVVCLYTGVGLCCRYMWCMHLYSNRP